MTWQNQQKALDLKTNLVTQLSNAATKIIVATQIAELGSASNESKSELYTAYRDWAIESSALGSQLRAYYPKTTIGAEWDSYSALVTNFYALTGLQNSGERKAYLAAIRKGLLPDNAGDVKWKLLVKWNDLPLRSPAVQRAWYALRTHVLNRKNSIIQEVLNNGISSY
jgi:hypothetical protein